MIFGRIIAVAAFTTALTTTTALVSAQEYQQSPVFDAAVAAGTLPPVAERLPDSPEVVTPYAEIGTYGGTMRRGVLGGNDHNNMLQIIGPQGLTRWDPDFTRVVPNLAESWETSDNGASWTFKLRPGLKWSDGQPMTADDILFFINDLLGNEEFLPVPPASYSFEGKRTTAEKIDDTTVVFKLAKPLGIFPEFLAGPLGQEPVFFARHYCEQFHPDYNPDVQTLITQAGVQNWPELMRLKCGELERPARWGNLERPTMDPWVVTEPYSGSAVQVEFGPNPYFWQVDTAGNQLPYIEKLNFNIYQDAQSLLLAAMSGNIDMQYRHLDSPSNRPALFDAQQNAPFHIEDVRPSFANAFGIYPNLNHVDEAKREILADKAFRIAFSHAIDREEIIDIVLLGQGQPWQVGVVADHADYNEQLATQYLEYDPDLARQMLEDAGYVDSDGDGVREAPNGTRLSFTIDLINTRGDYVDVVSLMSATLADVGIELRNNVVERALLFERVYASEQDWHIWDVPGGIDPVVDLRFAVPSPLAPAGFGLQWALWRDTAGAQGQEPPASVLERFELSNQYQAAVDAEERSAIVAKIFDIATEEFETIGISLPPMSFAVVADSLRNVPPNMPLSFTYTTPAPTLTQQYYFAAP